MKLYEKKFIDSKELSSQGAFSISDSVEFQVSVPRRCGAVSVYLHLFGEGIENKTYKKIPLRWKSNSLANDVFCTSINMLDVGIGLFYYKYEVVSDISTFYGEDKVNNCLTEIDKNSSNGLIQLLVYSKDDKAPSWIYGGIMYHIFVDRFCKSGKCVPKKSAIMNDDWYDGVPQYADKPGGYVENNMFFGGDLYGIIEKLDYIKSLGVNCIYLSPIFEAYSNHKYDTSDYLTIDAMFGGEKAFEELISAAKERDIHIILDGVFNHTGSNSIYFNKNGEYNSVGAYQSRDSQYYEWYNFKDYPDDYECWWDVKILPRVKSDTQSYKDFILGENGVIDKWMKKGIAGFRLDVADELSDDFLKLLNKRVKEVNPKGIVYGEVWEDASNKIAYGKRKKYFLGNELDSVMNYPLREAIIGYIKNGNARLFAETTKMLYSHYPKASANALMNVLGTHDTERILTVLGGEDGSKYTNEKLSTKKMTFDERKKAVSLLKLAYSINATMPGVPCIYYGDEVGQEGYRDPFNRRPFPWGKEDKDLLDFFRKIGKIRRAEKLFETGEFSLIECNENLLAYARYDEASFLLTIVNRGTKKAYFNSNVALKSVETDRKVSQIAPLSSCILKSHERFDNLEIEFYT